MNEGTTWTRPAGQSKLRTNHETALAVAGRYRLQCPAACVVPLADGTADAARQVREHPAVCPDPGPAVRVHQRTVLHPLVYAEPVRH